MSEVRNSEDVKNVLNNYALPVASYRAKRKEPSTLMVNAYLGAGGSYYTADEDFRGTVMAPIGIEYSRNGFTNTYFTERGRMSYSFMLSILDVGNIVNYRIDEDDENREVKFEQILSPGFLFNIGLSRKYPLALGFGYLFNPNRLSLNLAFDLPLFRLR